jgi:hypothetical protein
MKKIIMVLAFVLFLFSPSLVFSGATVKFAWDYEEPAPADLAGFVLQQKDGIEWVDVPLSIDKDARECVLSDVADGVYTWRLLAVDLGDIRSEPSNEVSETIDNPPPKPKNFRHITTITFEIRKGKIVAYDYQTEIVPLD